MNNSYVNYSQLNLHTWEVKVAISPRNSTPGYNSYHARTEHRTITVKAASEASAESAAIQMLCDELPSSCWSYQILSVITPYSSRHHYRTKGYTSYRSATESTPNLPLAFQEPKANGYYPYVAFFRVPIAA